MKDGAYLFGVWMANNFHLVVNFESSASLSAFLNLGILFILVLDYFGEGGEK